MNGAKARRLLPLALGLALVAAPGGLADPPAGREASRTPPVGAGPIQPLAVPDPPDLSLAPPDLLGAALRVEFGPGYERAWAEKSPERALALASGSLALLDVAAAGALPVAEPPAALLLLTLAGALGASRGTRRFPRRHPHR